MTISTFLLSNLMYMVNSFGFIDFLIKKDKTESKLYFNSFDTNRKWQ